MPHHRLVSSLVASVACSCCNAPFLAPQTYPFSTPDTTKVSRISGPGPLCSLSYLVQGLPDFVSGVDFMYSSSDRLEWERYLDRVLRGDYHPEVLQTAAHLLASRLYFVDNGCRGRPVLLLCSLDETFIVWKLNRADISNMTPRDRVFLGVLLTYFQASSRGDQGTGSICQVPYDSEVQRNVQLVKRQLRVARAVEPHWRYVSVYR